MNPNEAHRFNVLIEKFAIAWERLSDLETPKRERALERSRVSVHRFVNELLAQEDRQ